MSPQEMTLEERLERLLNAYSHHYDIQRDVEVEGGSFPAAAVYYLRDENYLFFKEYVLSAVENHEYVYFCLAQHLDEAGLEAQIELARRAGLAQIHPGKEHMSSFVTLVILADTIEPAAKKRIKRTRFKKYFRLALHGWMEFHIAAMECSTGSFFSNPAGRGARRTLESNFSSRPKK